MYIWKTEILFQARVLLGNSNSWGETTKAFIFSLNNTEGLAPFVSKVKKEYTGKAIRRNLYDGPQFGNDIIIADDANSSKYSKAVLDKYYSIPASVKNSDKALAGTSMFFNVDEVEVQLSWPIQLSARKHQLYMIVLLNPEPVNLNSLY